MYNCDRAEMQEQLTKKRPNLNKNMNKYVQASRKPLFAFRLTHSETFYRHLKKTTSTRHLQRLMLVPLSEVLEQPQWLEISKLGA